MSIDGYFKAKNGLETEGLLIGDQPMYYVSTNTEKLAVSGLRVGDLYTITDEAKRVERYLGGGNQDVNWAVLRPSFKIFVSHIFYDVPHIDIALIQKDGTTTVTTVSADILTYLGWGTTTTHISSNYSTVVYGRIYYTALKTADGNVVSGTDNNGSSLYPYYYNFQNLEDMYVTPSTNMVPRGRLYLFGHSTAFTFSAEPV